MEQGQEVGVLARQLYPDGILIAGRNGKSTAQVTLESISDQAKTTFFEATVHAAPFVAKADILRREGVGWHVLEVKSSFPDADSIRELISDLAYTVMVFQRGEFPVMQASLVLLSRQFRSGDAPDRLFEIVDCTSEVMDCVAKFHCTADAIAKALTSDIPPAAVLSSACRDCDFFHSKCLGKGIAHSVLEIPGLHPKKLKRLSDEGIVDLSRIPDDLGLNERQLRAKRAILSGEVEIDEVLGVALSAIAWPCHYLDFETVATVLPLYKGHRCHDQVLTQFSIHHRESIDAEPSHTDYLADATVDCQRNLAVALIAALGNDGSIIVYSGFERTRIKALRGLFPDLVSSLDAIVDRLVDLLSIVCEYVYHPSFKGSYSIKKVLPALVPELSYKGLAIANGETAITRFARMTRGEITGSDAERTRSELLDYCKLDTLAMLRLHEALHRMALQSAAGRTFAMG